MGRDTQAPLVPDHPARTLRGQVLLPDMHPIEIRRQAKIGAVIHDQAHFPPDAGLQFPRIFQDLPRRFLLIAVLQEPYSGGPQLLRPGKQGCATGKESGIEDGIETRKWGDQSQRIRRIDLAANLSIRGARAPSGKGFGPYAAGSSFFARNRSMNPVSNFPARNSGSARIRRCRGMVVKIPSTMNISSARAIRWQASPRSLPRTTSLAISES